MEHKALVEVLAAIAERLVSLAAEDSELRSQFRELAQVVLEATDRPPQQDRAPVPSEPQVEISVDVSNARSRSGTAAQHLLMDLGIRPEPVPGPVAPVVLPALTLGRSAPPAEPSAPSYPPHWTVAAEPDRAVIEARCRLKAEGARWAARRSQLLAGGAAFSTEIEPRDREIISRAKAVPDCFLWMCHSSGPSPSDGRLFEDVAGCFEAVAEILSVLRQIEDEPDLLQGEFEQSLDLLAEAQSALRMAILRIDGPADWDQAQVFSWLRTAAGQRQIYIGRHMRVDDPADPSRWTDLMARIEALESVVQDTRKRSKHRHKLLGKVRHKLSLVADEPDAADVHWRMLGLTVDELVAGGLPPSNRELRELLLPAIEDLPELSELPKGFELVLREIDRFLATSPPSERTSTAQPTAEVREVARLLEGRSIVLIGGERRPGSEKALREAFDLGDLIWIETREHQSIAGFEPSIARAEVALVLLAIRWTSHSFGEVRDFCERYGKPLVRLPGGYSPNQVAAQILAQCSERLKVQPAAEHRP